MNDKCESRLFGRPHEKTTELNTERKRTGGNRTFGVSINKKTASAILVAIAVLLVLSTATYAFYAMRIRGWPTTVTIQSFSFLLNGKECDDNQVTVDNTDLHLAKGQEADFILSVEVQGYATADFCVPYQIDMSFVGNDNQLARAVEVYLFDGNEYKYVSMLDDFIGSGLQIGDYDAVNPEVYTGINGPTTYKYKLVYSEAAGDYYENKTFTINIKAEHGTPLYAPDKYYVYSETDFATALSEINNADTAYTIVLLHDVTLTQDVAFTKKVGLDLNGFTLNTLNCSFSVTDNTVYTKALNPKFYALKVTDTAGGGSVTGNRITYTLAGDVIEVADALNDYVSISTQSFGVASLVSHLADNLDDIAKTPLPSSTPSGTPAVDLAYGFEQYMSLITLAPTDIDFFSAVDANGVATISTVFAKTMTVKSLVQLSVNNGAYYYSAYITLLGTSPYAISVNYANKVPDLITSSVFFPTYDSASGATITWVSGNSKIINSDGTFLPETYTALDDWTNQKVNIGMIIDLGDEKYVRYITREAEILSLEERTRILYSYPSLVLSDDDVITINEREDNLCVDDGIVSDLDSLYTKLGFVNATISVDTTTEDESNLNYTSLSATKWYVTNTEVNGAESNVQLTRIVKPESIGALILEAGLSFEYTVSNTAATPVTDFYNIARPLTVIGNAQTQTLNDATTTLQPSFSVNGYTAQTEDDFSFLVDGAYNNGNVLVEYSLRDNTWSDRIEIVNGIYIEDGNGLFVRENDGSFRIRTDDEAEGTQFYSRKSLIIVKPEFVTTETDTCYFNAKLISNTAPSSTVYTNTQYLASLDGVSGTSYQDAWGATDKIYVKEENEQNEEVDVTYELSLVVEGLYHNRAAEIADANMYTKLLTYYDKNSDSYISVNEALEEPTSPASDTAAAGITDAAYNSILDFSGLNISSVKGIEYFTNVKGLDYDTVSTTNYNSIIDLTYLSKLYALEYLSLKNNQVADISALAYLDALTYLDLGNSVSGANTNNITDISSIQYLPNVRYLDLRNNANLASIAPISDYTALRYLNLVGDTSLNSNYQQYFLALIHSKCSDNFTAAQDTDGIYYANAANEYGPTSVLLAAANALANIDIIDETFNTLRLPTTTVYNGVTYYLRWCSSNSSLLSFKDSGGNETTSGLGANYNATASWEIVSPTVDTDVDITLYISTENPGNTIQTAGISEMYQAVERQFTVNLMQLSGHSAMTYIECGNGVVRVASDVVPDRTLLGLLFSHYNQNASAEGVSVYTDSETGTYTLESENNGNVVATVKQSNIVTQSEILGTYNANNSAGTLNYSNSGITNLTGIDNFASGIYSLDLSGNIIAADADGDTDISPLSGLTNLTTLWLAGQEYDFSQLANFTDAPVQGETYDNSNGTIAGSGLTNLRNLSVFGCYNLADETVLASLYQVYLMNKNVDIYLVARYTGTTIAANIWNPYTLPMAEYLTTVPSVFNYVTLTTGANDWHTTCLYKDENNALRVNAVYDNNAYHYTFRFYDVHSIDFTISFANNGTGGILSASASSSNLKNALRSVNLSATESGTAVTGFKYKTLVGYTDAAYTVLTLNGSEGANITTEVGRNGSVTGDHYVEHMVDFNYHIKLNIEGVNYSINEVFPGRTLISAVMSAYSSNGFKINNENDILAGTVSGKDIVFTLGANKIYVGDTIIASGLFLTGGKSAIQGLQHTTVTTLNIAREAILGDGTWLTNVVNLYIGYSAVDLSALRVSLPNLKSFYIGKYSDTNTVKACWDINMYDVNEFNISDTSSNIYKYIVGLDAAGENYESIIGGTLPGVSDYLGASLQREAVRNTDTTGTEAAELYAGLREIARAKDASGHYYFYLNYLPNVETLYIRDTNITDWTGLLAYMFREDTAPANGTTNYHNAYYDKNKLTSISIYGTTGNGVSIKTENSNGGIAEPIIRKLYYASPDYEVSNASPDADGTKILSKTPTFRIGTIDDNKSSVDYHPEDFKTAVGGAITQGWHSRQFSHFEDYDDSYANYFDTETTPNTRLDRSEATQADEFLSKIDDFGVKMHDLTSANTASISTAVYHYASVSQTVPTTGTVYLPSTTEKAMFGTETDAEFMRSYNITWTLLYATAGAPSMPASADNGYYAYKYATAPTLDTYVVFQGVANADGETKTILCPVLFKGSDAYPATSIEFGVAGNKYAAGYAYSAVSVSYRQISDLQLRLYLYLNDSNHAPQINPSSVTALNLTSAAQAAFTNGIVSLDGIGIYQSIASITNVNGEASYQKYINDVSDLRYLTSLTSVILENCEISEVSWVKYLTALETLDLSGNFVKDISVSDFPQTLTALTTLNLNNNYSICHTDIEALSSLSGLETLGIYNTVASHEEAALAALLNIIGDNESLTLSMASSTPTALSHAALDAAYDYINGSVSTAGNYNALIGDGLNYDTSNVWNPANFGTGVTVAILDANICSGNTFTNMPGAYSAYKTVLYTGGFKVSVKLGVYNTVDYGNQIDIYKAAYVRDGNNSHNDYSLVFDTVTLTHADIDNVFYNYIVNNWECTINPGAKTLTFAPANRSIIHTWVDAGEDKEGPLYLNGIGSLKGLDRIPGLQRIWLCGDEGDIFKIDSLGFTTDNSSITSFTLGSYVDTRAAAMTTISRLTALETLNLADCTGIDYSASSLADTISGIASVTALSINPYINFYEATTGVESDAEYFLSSGNGKFGTTKSISSYDTFTATTSHHGEDTHTYYNRSRLSAVFNNVNWWKGDSLATKYGSLNSLGIDNREKLISYLSEFEKSSGNGRVLVPSTVCLSDLNGLDPDYTDRNVALTFTLPKTFYMFDTEYTVTWSIAADNSVDLTQTEPLMLTDSGNYYTLTFSSANLTDFEDGDVVTLTGVCNGATVTKSITIAVDEEPNYYTAATAAQYLTAFYIEMADGEIVQANQFFDSYRLLYWIFNVNKFNNGIKNSSNTTVLPQTLVAGGKVQNPDDVYTGKYVTLTGADKYLSYNQIMSVTAMTIATGADADSGIGSASLKGLELFQNLQSLEIRQGYMTSIDALRNMKLVNFVYNNSDTNNTNTIIQDWTPLYNSRDTLTTFTYMKRENKGSTIVQTYPEDFSFLSSFTALTDVSIGADNYTANLNETPAFKYLLAWNVIEGKTTTYTYNTVSLLSGGVASADAGISSKFLAASRILNSFRALDNADFDYINNYELIPKSNKNIDNTLILPGYIDYGGALYPIEWVSESAFADINYVTSGGGAITVADESAYFLPGAMSNRWTIDINDREAVYLSNIHVIARISVGGTIFERMLTINCADNNKHPSITFTDGFASYTFDATSAKTFTLINGNQNYYDITDSGRTLYLKAESVGHDVYVTVDGKKTKLEFSVDAAYFSTAASARTDFLADYAIIGNLAGTYQAEAALTARIAGYDEIEAGMWQYMYDAYRTDFDEFKTVYAGLTALNIPTINITYSTDSLGGYTNSNSATWHITAGDVSLANASINGYDFIGWYTDAAFANRITVLNSTTLASYLGGNSLTLYPKFLSTSNTINYVIPTTVDGYAVTATNPNAATLSPTSGTLTLTELTNITTDYRFDGWYLNSARTIPVTEITAATFKNTESLTVYAKIVSSAEKTVTYNLNQTVTTGLTHNNQTKFIGDFPTTLLSDVAIGEGAEGLYGTHRFKGWYTASAGGTKVTSISQDTFAVTSSVTLYAQYEETATYKYYYALTINYIVGKYDVNSEFDTRTFYYLLDSANSKDKIQMNSASSMAIVKLSDETWTNSKAFGCEWFFDDGASLATNDGIIDVTDTMLWSGTTETGSGAYTEGGACPDVKLGSYKVTYSIASDTVSFDYSTTAAGVYTMTGGNNNWSSPNNSAPNAAYTFVYLYTTTSGKDIYAMWLNISSMKQNTPISLRITEAQSGSTTILRSFTQNNVASSGETTVTISGFNSYTTHVTGGKATGMLFTFCPQGNYTTPNVQYPGNTYLDWSYSTDTYINDPDDLYRIDKQ